jgi:acetyl esterase/lipase
MILFHAKAHAGSRPAAIISIALMSLLATTAPLAAAPGDIVSIELEQTMLPGQIDAFVAKLYAGYPAPKASYTVDVYWVRFHSTYPDGQPAVAQAQVFVPRYVSGRQTVRVLYAFGPGSTGVIDSCRPSREHVAGIRWGLYRAHVLSHVGQGVIGVIPDYLGFGDPNRDQYYMVAEAEAAAMLDSIRATKALLAEKKVHGVTGTRNFTAGFSQGGHAAFAAADYQDSYAPEVELDGVIGYGPSTDLVALFKEFPSVAPMVLYTFRNLYGEDLVDPGLVLLPKYSVDLDDDITRQCVGGMQSYYPADPKQLFRPEFVKALLSGQLDVEYPALYEVLRANSTGLGAHGVPALICQGTDDIVVYDDTQKAFAAALEASGVDTKLAIYPGSRHDTRQVSFDDVQKWMRAALVSRGME